MVINGILGDVILHIEIQHYRCDILGSCFERVHTLLLTFIRIEVPS